MARLILIGAGSQVAKALAARFDDMAIVRVIRGEAVSVQDAVVTVLRYDEVPSGIAFGDAIVVNCVGTPHGDEATLLRVNSEVARQWGAAAVAGGARHFIQISSFSVFGSATRIGFDTPLLPVDPYGHAKLAAEKALSALHAPGFTMTLLRAPILIGGRDDKLAKLIRLLAAVRVVPVVRPPVHRSMLSYDGLAAAVRHAVDTGAAGARMVADPECFSYEMVRRIAREVGRPLVPVPALRVAAAVLRKLSPGLARRLFASSELEAEANFSIGAPPFVRVSEVVSVMLRR